MSDYTVLVLGAGASLPYGLPLGKGLVEKICELLPINDKYRLSETASTLYNELAGSKEFIISWRSVSTKDPVYALMEFRQRLAESDPKSIDAFLSRDFEGANQAFKIIGKLAIAYVIAANETIFTSNFGFGPENDHWYRYLWQDCINSSCQNYDDIKTKKLRIISFNYDRSLEYFLGRKLAATYFSPPGTVMNEELADRWGKAGFEAVESDIQITHPYGKLGSLIHIPFGSSKNPSYHGLTMASNIKVIGEDRSKDNSFNTAKEWLATAKKVVFLGFSYDETNMERLGLTSGLPRRIQTSQSINSRQVFPLTYGLERAERLALTRKYFSDFDFEVDKPSNDYSAVSEAHQSMPITQYLRRYGGLTGL